MPSLPFSHLEYAGKPQTVPHPTGQQLPEPDSGQPNDQVPPAHWNQGQPESPGVPVWNQDAHGGPVHATASTGADSADDPYAAHPLVQSAGAPPWANLPMSVGWHGGQQNLGAPSGGGGIGLPFHMLASVARILPKA